MYGEPKSYLTTDTHFPALDSFKATSCELYSYPERLDWMTLEVPLNLVFYESVYHKSFDYNILISVIVPFQSTAPPVPQLLQTAHKLCWSTHGRSKTLFEDGQGSPLQCFLYHLPVLLGHPQTHCPPLRNQKGAGGAFLEDPQLAKTPEQGGKKYKS